MAGLVPAISLRKAQPCLVIEIAGAGYPARLRTRTPTSPAITAESVSIDRKERSNSDFIIKIAPSEI
jgi:hypothetical protein